jgi:hypothetical protein
VKDFIVVYILRPKLVCCDFIRKAMTVAEWENNVIFNLDELKEERSLRIWRHGLEDNIKMGHTNYKGKT